MDKKKHIILSYIFTVLGVIIGVVSLILVISMLFDRKGMCYPLIGILSFLVAAFLFFFTDSSGDNNYQIQEE